MISDALLGPAVGPKTPCTLGPGLAGPEQDQQGEQEQSGDRRECRGCHGVVSLGDVVNCVTEAALLRRNRGTDRQAPSRESDGQGEVSGGCGEGDQSEGCDGAHGLVSLGTLIQ